MQFIFAGNSIRTLLSFLLISGNLPVNNQDLQARLDAIGNAGGGTVRFEKGERVTIADGVVLPPRVILDLNGGELVTILTNPNAAGVRLLSGSVLRNGIVTVLSRGTPSPQAGAHAPVLIGALYGENQSPSQLSRFESPSDWKVSEMVLQSDKLVTMAGSRLGAAAIQVVGGANNGLIENITVPNSSRMAGGIMLDWGTVGPISSRDVPASATAFRSGKAWTTHPYNIRIRGIHIGALTRPATNENGSFGVRLSGTHDITVKNLHIDHITEAAILITAGDLGLEFALPVDRERGLRGTVIDGVHVKKAGAYLLRSDSFADNIARAAQFGYRPELPPISKTDTVVRNVCGKADGTTMPGWGLRVNHQWGGTFSDIAVRGFRRGFVIDEQVYDVELLRPLAVDSTEAAITVEHPARPPRRIKLTDLRGRGTNAMANTVIIGKSHAVTINGAQNMSLQITREAANPSLKGNIKMQRE